MPRYRIKGTDSYGRKRTMSVEADNMIEAVMVADRRARSEEPWWMQVDDDYGGESRYYEIL